MIKKIAMLIIILIIFTASVISSYRNQTDNYRDKFNDNTYTINKIITKKSAKLKTNPKDFTGKMLAKGIKFNEYKDFDKDNIILNYEGIDYYVSKKEVKVERISKIKAIERIGLSIKSYFLDISLFTKGIKSDPNFGENLIVGFFDFTYINYWIILISLFLLDKLFYIIFIEDSDLILKGFSYYNTPLSRLYTYGLIISIIILIILTAFGVELVNIPDEEMFNAFLRLKPPINSPYIFSWIVYIIGKLFPLSIIGDGLYSRFKYKNSIINSIIFMIFSLISTSIFMLFLLSSVSSVIIFIGIAVVLFILSFIFGGLGSYRVVYRY